MSNTHPYGREANDETSVRPVHEIHEIPVQDITVSALCQRQEEDHDIGALADNIRRRDLIEFPTVVEAADGYTLLAGSRRYAACKHLGWKTIPCHVVEATPAQAACLSFSENAFRKKRHPVEEAKVLQHLKDLGLTETQIAEEIGLPQSGVNERLGLLLLGEDVLRRIGTGPDSPLRYTHAVMLSQVMRTHRPNREMEVRELLAKTIRYRLSSAELEGVVRLMRSGEFDHLPARLQMWLLTNRNMTAELASLFLDPGKVVPGDGAEAHAVRQKAGQVGPEELVDFIAEAVQHGWSYAEAKERLLRMVKEPARRRGTAGDTTSAKTFLGRLHTMNEELQARLHDLATLGEAKPEDIERLRTVLSQLARQAEFLAKSLTEKQSQIEALSAADSGKESVRT